MRAQALSKVSPSSNSEPEVGSALEIRVTRAQAAFPLGTSARLLLADCFAEQISGHTQFLAVSNSPENLVGKGSACRSGCHQDTDQVLGKTFGVCILQDFEAWGMSCSLASCPCASQCCRASCLLAPLRHYLFLKSTSLSLRRSARARGTSLERFAGADAGAVQGDSLLRSRRVEASSAPRHSTLVWSLTPSRGARPSIGCGASWPCKAIRGCAVGALRPARRGRGRVAWMCACAALVHVLCVSMVADDAADLAAAA